MKFFFWRKDDLSNQSAYAPYEEIDSKKTSKLGYFFLILMVIFGIFQGNVFLDDIQDSIAYPERNSSCLDTLARRLDIERTSPQYYNYYSYQYTDLSNGEAPCQFSNREVLLSIDDIYKSIAVEQNEIDSLGVSTNNLNAKKYSIESEKNTLTAEYQASLLEDIAGKEDTAFNQASIQAQLTIYSADLQNIEKELRNAETRIATLENKIRGKLTPHKDTFQKAYDAYDHDMVVYEFKRFLLSLLFIAPLFAVVWRYYHRLKNSRSEYTIIWGGAVAVVGFMLAQILLVFIYEILPKQILQQIFKILSSIEILWAVVTWFGFILVPVFFGFLIYLIQKKFYNKRAVMMRALKSEHCPGCSLKINHTMNNCPVCGYRLKTKCASCGSMSMAGGLFCETCGSSRPDVV